MNEPAGGQEGTEVVIENEGGSGECASMQNSLPYEKTRIGAPWQGGGRQMYGATWFHVAQLGRGTICGWSK